MLRKTNNVWVLSVLVSRYHHYIFALDSFVLTVDHWNIDLCTRETPMGDPLRFSTCGDLHSTRAHTRQRDSPEELSIRQPPVL
jgi:hypothetical protein